MHVSVQVSPVVKFEKTYSPQRLVPCRRAAGRVGGSIVQGRRAYGDVEVIRVDKRIDEGLATCLILKDGGGDEACAKDALTSDGLEIHDVIRTWSFSHDRKEEDDEAYGWRTARTL